MMTNICFGLICLLIPLIFELLSLQTQLQLSKPGHALVEILILGAAWWVILQILRWDERLYLRNLTRQNDLLLPVKPMTRQSGDRSPATLPDK